MQLLYSPTSPYARKCRVAARERGLMSTLEEVEVNPHEDPEELRAKNPLGKVPTLVLDDGRAVFDSPVICELFDSFGRPPSLIPATGRGRFTVLVTAALAQGMTDSAVNMVMEGRRKKAERSEAAVERWRGSIERSLALLAAYVKALPGGMAADAVTLGHISCATTLGYLDLRHGDMNWRNDRDELAAWFAEFNARPSMQETDPN